MLNICMPMLGYQTTFPKEYYDFGFVIHTLYARQYPNGGWLTITHNKDGVTSVGSWGTFLLPRNFTYDKSKKSFIVDMDHDKDLYGNPPGNNITGSARQIGYWTDPYEDTEIKSFGYELKDVLQFYLVASTWFDSWSGFKWTINLSDIQSAIADGFRRYPNGYKPNGFPHSYTLSRGSGSNSVPTLIGRLYVTAFRKKNGYGH